MPIDEDELPDAASPDAPRHEPRAVLIPARASFGLTAVATVLGCAPAAGPPTRAAIVAAPIGSDPAPAPAPPPAASAPPARDLGVLTFAVDPGTAPDVLADLFPHRLASESRCPSRNRTSLEQERTNGWVVPRIVESRTGAFTRRGARETAVLVAVGECNPFGFESGGSKLLVVVGPDGAIDFRSGEIFDNGIAATTDLDLDGVDELVLTTSGMAQGHVAMRAEWVSLDGGRWRSRDLGPVADDDSATGKPDAGGHEGVWIVTPVPDGGAPAFHVELRGY